MTPEALDALYREHASETSREVVRILGEHSLAEDCVHDICVRLLLHKGEITYQRQLLRVASVNRARDMMRRRCSPWDKRAVSNDASAAANSLPDGDGTMEDAMIEDERVARIGEAVRAAIQMLPDILSDVLWRHHAEGQTVPFIAAAIGVPESAIKMRLMRGRAAIRVILAEDPRAQRD